MRVKSVHGRQVLDSRGKPTVEVDVVLQDGTWGRAAVPSGASTGRHEAVELRDGDPEVFGGNGVLQAVHHVNTEIARAVMGLDPRDQEGIDQKLVELDGTPNKSRLGANALLGVSLAVAVAAARAKGLPLYRHIAELFGAGPDDVGMPLPMVNMVSGGLHAGRQVDLQDVLFVPIGAKTYSEAMQRVYQVHRAVQEVLRERGDEARLVADEGGWGPALSSNEEAMEVVVEAVKRVGLEPGVQGALAVDVASTHFFEEGMYRMRRDGSALSSRQMVERLEKWVERYGILSIEDGMAEDDWEGWRQLTQRLGDRVQILGDDLFTTSVDRLRQGLERGAANAILIKLNQVGTLTETLSALRLAKENGYRTVVSARSGETEDTFIADLAVGTGAGQIKIGSITRSERLAKYNQLFRIEEEVGNPEMAMPFR